jgi:uncharacterized RDD family membrane protein YckC
MIYEAVILFGIFFSAGLLFDLITQSKNPLPLRTLRQIYLFIVIGAYFTYFWGHGGQTLAMKTWRIKVTAVSGHTLRFKQACIRYCLSWLWFLPALAASALFDIQHWLSFVLLGAGVALWASTILLNPDRQFLHDTLAKTRLIILPPNPNHAP